VKIIISYLLFFPFPWRSSREIPPRCRLAFGLFESWAFRFGDISLIYLEKLICTCSSTLLVDLRLAHRTELVFVCGNPIIDGTTYSAAFVRENLRLNRDPRRMYIYVVLFRWLTWFDLAADDLIVDEEICRCRWDDLMRFGCCYRQSRNLLILSM
jgi:hypothetical protein